MKRPDVSTLELIRMYRSGLCLRDIAAEVGMTYQAVHARLKAVGFRMYHRTYDAHPLPKIDASELRRLYVDEFVSLEKTAKLLNAGTARVKAELERQGIPVRGRGTSRRSEFYSLQVGGSVEVVRATHSNPVTGFRKAAKRLGYQFGISSLGQGRWRVTRTR